MANVKITTPSIEQIAESFAPFIQAALSVAAEAPRIIKDRAILDNEDVTGEQMPPKVPKPQNNPRNFPNLPLIQDDDPDLMDNARWTVEETNDTTRTLIYDPPEHLAYLLDKPQVPGGGGRHWIGRDGTINPNAMEEIQQKMAQKILDAME